MKLEEILTHRKQTRTYTCGRCADVFESGWTEGEAVAELHQNGLEGNDDLVVVCDDCYFRLKANGAPLV